MYEHDGEKYYILDAHLHFWDASPENWVKGREQFAKGWIECFHAYQGLGPEDTHWTIEHFMKYSVDDFEKDVFTEGKVDHAVFQSTYLKDWYTEGFNTATQNAPLLERFPGKLTLNGRWDPREGEAGPSSSRRTPSSTTSRASSSTPPSGTTARAGGPSTIPRHSFTWRSARSWA